MYAHPLYGRCGARCCVCLFLITHCCAITLTHLSAFQALRAVLVLVDKRRLPSTFPRCQRVQPDATHSESDNTRCNDGSAAADSAVTDSYLGHYILLVRGSFLIEWHRHMDGLKLFCSA